MNRSRAIYLIFVFAVLVVKVHAQLVVPDRIIPDTVLIQRQYDESNRFYDKLKEKSENSKFAKRLYRALVSSDNRMYKQGEIELNLEKETSYFREYEGRIINSIHIYRNNVFSDVYSKGDIRAWANGIHVVTEEKRIRRNLLFREGDPLSSMIMAQTEQILRSQDYLSDASILIKEDKEGEGVDVYVMTRDSWSVGVTIRSVPTHKRYLDIYDDNFLGRGNRIDLRTYFSFRDKFYGGQMLEYTASNFLGSFFEVNAIAGWGFDERRLGLKVHKPFILPTDYMVGTTLENNKYYDRQMAKDTVLLIRHFNYDFWAGKSWDFPAMNSSFFMTSRYNDLKFRERPEVLPDSNSRYHDRRLLLFSTGIYRERFYKGNMIYGFGRNENIPYGHRFELTAGRHWGEFEDRWYTAMTAVVGRQNRWGYLRGEASASTFWKKNGQNSQTIANLELDWFSNLWKRNRKYLRQFGKLRYMQGWSRYEGEGDILTLWDDSSLQGVRRNGITGTNRLIINTETVLFTPIYLYGFRFVFFAFGDVGWIGNKPFVVENPFYSSVGIGVRLRNERLNINTIQLRLGLGFGRNGLIDYRHFRYTSQSRFQVPPFNAGQPELYQFR